MKKQILKSLIIKLSKENSLITQFTSFVAVEKRVCIVILWLFHSYLHIKKIILALSQIISMFMACEEQGGKRQKGPSNQGLAFMKGLNVRAHDNLSK